MTSGGNKFNDFRASQLSKMSLSLYSKGNIAQQETKQLFLSSRKYLFHSHIASAIDSVNQIFYECDSSDIPAYVVSFL